jgi:phosphatidylserine/phosphatidylglycerophosphate/cardiolipin synthase-like enzyme
MANTRPVDLILDRLRESLQDEILTKAEKKDLQNLVGNQPLSTADIQFLTSQLFIMAREKATASNYDFILEWIRQASGGLTVKQEPVRIAAYFSPGEACRNTIVQQLEQATRRIRICVFTISDDRITDAIVHAHRKGVDIRVLTDNDKSLDLGSDIERLAREKISVRMDNTTNHMHHKFMVTDDKTLITGSYNWTVSAARYNHENILLTEEPGAVKEFLHQFERLWGEMTPFG